MFSNKNSIGDHEEDQKEENLQRSRVNEEERDDNINMDHQMEEHKEAIGEPRMGKLGMPNQEIQ